MVYNGYIWIPDQGPILRPHGFDLRHLVPAALWEGREVNQPMAPYSPCSYSIMQCTANVHQHDISDYFGVCIRR